MRSIPIEVQQPVNIALHCNSRWFSRWGGAKRESQRVEVRRQLQTKELCSMTSLSPSQRAA